MKKYCFFIIGLPLLGSALINHNDDLSVGPILTQNLEATAFQYLEQHKKEYQLDDVKEDIKIDRVESDKFGLTHTYFQRYYQGVPIYGANIRTHQAQSGKILSVSEKSVEIQKEIITTPTIKPSQAASISKKHFSKLKINPQIKTVNVQASIPELYIYDRSLLSRHVGSNPKLVWRLNIGLKNTSQQYIYYIDAHTGYVVHYLNSTAHARDRETYVLSTTPDCNTATLTYNEAGIVGSYDADAGWVHLFAAYAYDYFYNTFGRDSFDDEDPSDATDGGGTIKSYTHFRNPDSCSDEFDAGWSSQITEPYEFMYFAEGVYSQDIVGHEFTHGVVDHSANLEYENESAALDESYADIFGTLIEHYTGDTDWTIGEDLPSTRSECITALRSLADPTAYTGYCDGRDDADPDHINDLGGDFSDQYAASVIPSYAFYLLVEGGTHPESGEVVTNIGESAAAEIYYQTLTHYLSTASNFDDAYTQTLTACLDMNNSDSTTYPISYCESVFDAFAAVGINTDISYAWADISTSATSGTAPLTITFDGTGSTTINSTITDYTWDFGDGSTDNGSTVSYTYSNPGTYTVTLTVTDSNGYTGTASTTITVYVSGTISSDTTWAAEYSPYVITSGVTVSSGTTLTIEPGTIIKFYNAASSLTINGTLDAQGTSTDSIIFTSYKDDDNGGDTNGDGTATTPAAGDWQQIDFASGSIATLDYVTIQYGGQSSSYPMVNIESDNVTISNGTIANGGLYNVYISSASPNISTTTITAADYYGVYIDNASPTLDSNTVTDNIYFGVYVYGSLSAPSITNNTISNNSYVGVAGRNASPILSGNIISGNLNYGIEIWNGSPILEGNTISSSYYGVAIDGGSSTVYGNTISNNSIGVGVSASTTISENLIYDNTTYGLYNFYSSTVIAESNWWGHASGPYNLNTNPSGTGDSVSDYVDFDPWLTADPTADTTPPSDVTLGTTRKDAWAQTITLNWTNPTDSDFDHVQIDRTDVVAGTTTTLSSSETGTSYLDSIPSYNTTYTYTLYTIDTAGNTSTGVTTSNQRLRNPTPTNLTVTAGDTTITATWTASSAPITTLGGYIVYYGTSRTALTNSIDVGNTTSITLTGLTNGTRYYVAVSAYSTGGDESTQSSIRATRPHP